MIPSGRRWPPEGRELGGGVARRQQLHRREGGSAVGAGTVRAARLTALHLPSNRPGGAPLLWCSTAIPRAARAARCTCTAQAPMAAAGSSSRAACPGRAPRREHTHRPSGFPAASLAGCEVWQWEIGWQWVGDRLAMGRSWAGKGLAEFGNMLLDWWQLSARVVETGSSRMAKDVTWLGVFPPGGYGAKPPAVPNRPRCGWQ